MTQLKKKTEQQKQLQKKTRVRKQSPQKQKRTKLIKSTYNITNKDFMADPKVISLSIGERLAALRLFDAFKGNLSTLATLLDDVKAFSVTNEEWEKAERIVTDNPDGTAQWKWTDGDAQAKELTLQEASAQYLKDEIKKKNDAGEITLADVSLLTLEKKI